MKNRYLHTDGFLPSVSKKTTFLHRHALLAGAYICLLLGFSAFFRQTCFASSDVFAQPTELSASITAAKTTDAQQDTRLRLLTKKQDYRAFLLGSFPAYGYDAAVLESFLSVKAYHLAAGNLSET